MPSIVVHNFIMTYKSSACPAAPPEGKLGTTLRVEDRSLVSPGTTAGTPEGLERSVGGGQVMRWKMEARYLLGLQRIPQKA